MINSELIKNFSIDKSDWVKVKFGDIVYEPKESVKDPVTEGVEHVVGLEHIDSEDIHLRRSASIEESTTFTKKFSKGDVLFGRRRAYLKKAAKADFEGICSGDITVMRANDKLLPGLLPFIVNNDKFFDYAIQHSAGGLSPRVKFKDLANLEFLLPPSLEQNKILNLFQSLDDLIQTYKNLQENMNALIQVKTLDLLRLNSSGILPNNWSKILLKDISPLQRGFDLPNDKLIEGSYPVAYSNGIKKYHSSFQVKGPGVWTGRSGTIGNVFYTEDDYWPHNTTLWVTDFKENHPKFIYHLFSNMNFEKHSAGTGVPTLNRNDIHKLKVSIPNEKEIQVQISSIIDEMHKSLSHLVENNLAVKQLQKSVINKVF